jgi:drug/metabolite transporter (DMT)-like permease
MAYACLALSMSLVGGYVALSKPLIAAFPVLLLAWLRFGIAALAMPHWLKRTPDEPPMTARTRWLVFLESFLGNFLFSICMLFGVSLTSAVSAGVIMASIPACVAVASWLFLRERITVRIGLAIGCAARHRPAGVRRRRTPRHRPRPCSRRCHGWATCWCSARCSAKPPMR